MRAGGEGWVIPSPEKSKAMRSVRTIGTSPEMALRRGLYAAGLRFRVAYPVPGRARRTIDVALTRRRLAVFVDGCFWHGCPQHGSSPKTNAAFWSEKVYENRRRDRDTDLCLIQAGWSVLRFWEHVPSDDAVSIVLAWLASVDAGVTS